MNLHPIVVHFPIALLIIYTALEVILFFIPNYKKQFTTTKLVFLFIGVVGTFSALQSGEIAQELLGKSELIHTHEEFGEKTHMIYSLIALISLLQLVINYRVGVKYWSPMINKYLPALEQWLNSKTIQISVVILSILGVILLSITGALGGAISHGSNADPMVKFIYGIFISQ